jgi:hypothetical protein
MDLPETVQDAVDVLQDLVRWEMTAPRWEHVAELLTRIDAAFARDDAGELRAAVAELEDSEPVRIVPIGSKPATGIPQPVLDRRNTLVHTLTAKRDKRDPC